MLEGYGIYKNNIYGANGQLIGKYTENTVFTRFGAWEMHETDGNYYLRAVGATILGVPIGQNIQGNLLAIGTNAFLTIENNLIRCYDFSGNLVYDFNAIGTVQKPPLILNNTLITPSAAYNLADGTQIPGHPGGGILDRQIVHEGKLYRWSTGVDENNVRYYEINHIDPGTGNIIKTVRTTESLQREWVGNINLGYYNAVNPTGRYIAQIVDLDTGECIGITLIGGSLSSVYSYVLGNEIYVEIRTPTSSGTRVEWYRLEYDAEEDQFKRQVAKKQKHFDKQYITHYETFTAHIEEELENPLFGITPNQVFIKSEEIKGQENTSYYKYPLSENIVFTKENLNVTEILIDNKSVNYSIDGDKVMVQADDINAALEEEDPIFYEYGNRLIEKKNITILFETDKGQKTAMVTQERVISGNIEQDVEEGNIIYDPERDEPLYPDDPDYEEEKPQYPPVPGEEPLVFGDDGYPYSEDRGPIWSNHPDHPAFGIEEVYISPAEAEIFPNQEANFEVEITYKEGITQSKSLEEILNISYSEDSLEIEISNNQIKATGTKLTDNAYISVAIKGKFSGDRKRKMTSRTDIRVVSPIQNISITPSEAIILHEQTQDFEVEVLWKEGAEQQDVSQYITFTWPNLLEAEQDGARLTVTATRPVRNARIRAVLEGELLGWHAAEATLTVKQVIESIQIMPKNATLVKGQRQEFQVEITWAEGAQEKPLEEICDVTSDSAILVTEITGNRIEVVPQKIALNARLVVKIKDEFLPPNSYLGATAYIRVISFRELIPDYPPLSALRLRFKAGSSSYEMGNYLIDRYSYRERDTVVNLEARNPIGQLLRDQQVGDNRNFIGTGSEVIEELLEAAGVQAYVAQQDFVEQVHLELNPKDTFLSAIEQVLESKPGWAIYQDRHDSVYPGNFEVVLVGDEDFLAQYKILKRAYVFRRDRDIFSREIVKSADNAYGRVCVHTPDWSIELYQTVENNLGIMSRKTFFYEVPNNTTTDQAETILARLVRIFKDAGKTETFVTAFRPHIEPGDVAYILNENSEEEEIGIITSVTHNFGRNGFYSEFTIDSASFAEKETLLKLTLQRLQQEPAVRLVPSRHKIIILGSGTEI